MVVRVPEEEADVGDGKENVDEIEAFIEAAANGRQRENAQAKEDGEGRGTAVLFTDGILASRIYHGWGTLGSPHCFHAWH